MSKIERATREDFMAMINSPSVSKEEILAIIEEELDLVIDPDLSKEEMVDEIFSAYNNSIIEVEENKRKAYIDNKLPGSNRKKRKSKKKGGSVKDYIIDLIKENKYTKKEILELTDEKFQYRARGKSPKVRVSNVVRSLKKSKDLLESVDGTLGIKGYKKED